MCFTIYTKRIGFLGYLQTPFCNPWEPSLKRASLPSYKDRDYRQSANTFNHRNAEHREQADKPKVKVKNLSQPWGKNRAVIPCTPALQRMNLRALSFGLDRKHRFSQGLGILHPSEVFEVKAFPQSSHLKPMSDVYLGSLFLSLLSFLPPFAGDGQTPGPLTCYPSDLH